MISMKVFLEDFVCITYAANNQQFLSITPNRRSRPQVLKKAALKVFTAQKMKFYIKDFFSKCKTSFFVQCFFNIHRKLSAYNLIKT